MTAHATPPELRTERLTDHVFAFIQGDGGWGYANAGLVADGGQALLVDTFFTLAQTQRLRDALTKVAPTSPVETVVNTHLNGDHCWGNQLFPDAEVITSEANVAGAAHEVPPALFRHLQEQPPPGQAGRYLLEHFGHFDFSGIHRVVPAVTFSQRMELSVGSVAVELLDVGPAHTDGDVVVHVPEAGVVFCGDVLFHRVHPVVWSGPLTTWVSACDRLLDTGAKTFVPGHGPLAARGDLCRFRDYLCHVQEHGAREARAGTPLEEAVRKIPLDAYERWSGPERLVTALATVYRHLGVSAPQQPMELLMPVARLAQDFNPVRR
ncbi:MBL fold metallo-hydrolase [Streptomyces sp. NPDC048172]|uniref:MBL fold metallo-hydrolase n=1 Tax=Streptomyces sp. NPDC048172 TaxID=3365505 RepID=UPI00371B4695